MASPEQEQVDELVRARPPIPGASLEGWVLLADWRTTESEEVVTVMGSPDAHIVELKGVLHEGLYDIARGMYQVAGEYIEDMRRQNERR